MNPVQSNVSFLSFPDEIKQEVFWFLSIKDIFNCLLTCKNFNTVLSKSNFWKRRLQAEFPEKYHSITKKYLNDDGIQTKKQNIEWQLSYQAAYRVRRHIIDASYLVTEVDLRELTESYDIEEGIETLVIQEDRIIDLKLGGSFRIINYKTEKIDVFPEQEPVDIWSVKIHGNKILAGLWDGTIQIWDIDEIHDPKELKYDDSAVLFLNVQKNSIISGSQNGIIRFWNLESGDLIKSFSTIPEEKQDNYLENALIFNEKILTTFNTGLQIWDLNTGKPELTKPFVGKLKTVEFSGGKIIGFERDVCIKVWDAETYQFLHEIRQDILTSSYKLTTSLLLLGMEHGETQIWDYHTGECMTKWQTHDKKVTHVEIFDDQIVTCSYFDHYSGRAGTEMKIWDVQSKTLLLTNQIPFVVERLKVESGKMVFSFEDTIAIWDFNQKSRNKNSHA